MFLNFDSNPQWKISFKGKKKRKLPNTLCALHFDPAHRPTGRISADHQRSQIPFGES
jgi:hypothetical protein